MTTASTKIAIPELQPASPRKLFNANEYNHDNHFHYLLIKYIVSLNLQSYLLGAICFSANLRKIVTSIPEHNLVPV